MSVRIEEERTVVAYGKTIDFLIKIPTTLRQILNYFFFPVALRPNTGHGLLILEVSRSHTTTHHSR